MRVLLRRNPILILSSILFILLLILILQPASLRHNDDVVDDVDDNDVTGINEVTKYASYDKSPYMRRTQPGYMGSGVKLKKNEKKAEDEGYKRHSFNQLVSDKISLERSLPDYRNNCLLYTSPSPRDKRQSRMPSSA